MIKFIKRIGCWIKGYHENGAYRFRYDCSGYCEHCGKVGSGKIMDDGE